MTELFDRTGLAYKVPDDILREQWNKLMLNTGVNQVTAVYGAPYSLIQKEGEARTMMIEAMREVLRVADTQDIDLTERTSITAGASCDLKPGGTYLHVPGCSGRTPDRGGPVRGNDA